MEGTVTISLKDYEELKEQEKVKKNYLNTALKQVRLLEEVERFLKIEHGCLDHPTLLEKVNNILAEWYG